MRELPPGALHQAADGSAFERQSDECSGHLRELSRRINANRLNGVDSEFLTPQQVKEFCPPIDLRGNGRYPVLGASLQRRGGTARHDAVAWGYARAADALGRSEGSGAEGLSRGEHGA